MKAGAVDFLTKPFRDQDLLDAVGAALEKDRGQRAGLLHLAELRRRFEALTERERHIMALVVAGRSSKEIAHGLLISDATVKIYRRKVRRKMKAASLAELVRMADRLNPTEG